MKLRVTGSIFDQDRREWVEFSEVVEAESGDAAAEIVKEVLAPRAGRVAVKGIMAEPSDGSNPNTTDPDKNQVNAPARPVSPRGRGSRAA